MIGFGTVSSLPRKPATSSNRSESHNESFAWMNMSAALGAPVARSNISASLADVAEDSNQLLSNTTTGLSVVTSDCAHRLNSWSHQSSACIYLRDNSALLVYVPYGESPGWDLPGGQKKGKEPACETAERETCEETGYKVRAVAKLTDNVFLCQYVASNVCVKSVDEGFLDKQWYGKSQIDSLRFRGGTWGDKRGLLHRHLR